MKKRIAASLCTLLLIFGTVNVGYASDFTDTAGEAVMDTAVLKTRTEEEIQNEEAHQDAGSDYTKDIREFTDGTGFTDGSSAPANTWDEKESAQSPGEDRIVENGLIYRKLSDGTLSLVGYEGNPVDCIIPSSVQNMTVVRIAEGAFMSCETLKSVQMPDTIIIMGVNAFRSCRNLEYIKLSNRLEGIPRDAFALCTGLLEIKIPGSVKGISMEAFALCDSLKEAEFEEGIRAIRMDAFSYCKSLKEVVFPSTVQRIEDGAFNGSGLEKATFMNRGCVLEGDYIFPLKTVLYGYTGSTAQVYADQNGHMFIAIEDSELETADLLGIGIAEKDAINITWRAVPYADGYEVFRKKNGQWVKIADCGSGTNNYTDSDTQIGRIYTYTVRAYRKSTEGMLYGKRDENGLWIRQYFDQTPVAIRDTRRLSDGSLGIKWETRRKAEGYEIFRKEAGGSWKRIKTVGKVNSYRDKTCRPGTRYYYRVRAYAHGPAGKVIYNEGKGPDISLVSRLLQPSVKAEAVGRGQVRISWTRQSGVTGYMVCRREEGTSKWTRIYAAGAGLSSYVDKTAKRGKTYYYMVRAYKKADEKGEIFKNIYGPYLKNGIRVKIL